MFYVKALPLPPTPLWPIRIEENFEIKFECDLKEDTSSHRTHLHWLTTKVIKLDENPSWEATKFHRVHDLRDLTELIHSITSSPNVITRRGKPGDEGKDEIGREEWGYVAEQRG